MDKKGERKKEISDVSINFIGLCFLIHRPKATAKVQEASIISLLQSDFGENMKKNMSPPGNF